MVTDEGELYAVLRAALDRNDITDDEYARAYQEIVSRKCNHSVCNVLSKRVVAINQFRLRVEGAPRLRIKS